MTIRQIALAFCLTAAATAPLLASDMVKKPLNAETLWQLQRLGAPAIAPDGATAIVPVSKPDVGENKLATDLWLIKTDGGGATRFTSQSGSDSSPAFSPDGRFVAFVSKREGDKAAQLYVIPTDGGEAKRVTEIPTGVMAPKWFPDSRRIAFLSRVFPDLASWDEQGKRLLEHESSKARAKTWDRAPIRWWDSWLDERETHVFAVDHASGAVQDITRGRGRALPAIEPSADHYDIAPDGREIAFVSDVDTTGVDSNLDVFVMLLEGGAPQNLTAANGADDTAPLYSPDGALLAFQRQVIKGFYADRVRLVIHERATKRERIVTDGWDRSVSGLVWQPDAKAMLGAIDDAATQRVYRIPLDGGPPQAITSSPSFSHLALDERGRTLVALRQSFAEPPTLVRIDLGNGSVKKLSTFNDEKLAGVAMGRYESVTYPGSGGAPIQMWVVYPPDFDPSRKYPVYLLLHGGPHNGITDGFHFRWSAQVFAGWGAIVAWHNFHGSSGFGQDFADSINPDWLTKPYEDTIAAAEYLAKQPFVDKDRMAAGGGSYGGYLATVLLGREHPFKALVSHCGVYNAFTQYAADYGAGKRRHGEFWEQPERYAEVSPHMAAASFKTPTLVYHGLLDYRVPYNHGIELFQTLQNKGVPSRLVIYEDEGHWVLKPQNSLHWYDEKFDWLEKFILAPAENARP